MEQADKATVEALGTHQLLLKVVEVVVEQELLVVMGAQAAARVDVVYQ
jgi:hypothetical protein